MRSSLFRDTTGRGALGKATNRHRKEGLNPTPSTVCGSIFFFSFPPNYWCVCPFLSCPYRCLAPNHPFSHSPFCAAYFIYLIIICEGLCCSTAPPHPFPIATTSLCSLSSLPPVALLHPFSPPSVPCSLADVHLSFPPGTVPHIPLFHVVPHLPPALRSQRRWQPRCRMREGAPGPGSRSRPHSPAAL